MNSQIKIIGEYTMKLDLVANSGNDEFFTPLYAIEPILKYVKPNSVVWCPFDTDESLFVKALKQGGAYSNKHAYCYGRRIRLF